MRALRRAIGWIAALALMAIVALLAWATMRGRPQDLPWTPLDLSQPVGMFTGRQDRRAWRRFREMPRAARARGGPLHGAAATSVTAQCGYADGVRFAGGGARRIAFTPPALGVACPVAAGAGGVGMGSRPARRPPHLRQRGRRAIDHFGSYNCRRMYGRDAGAWSEHATADAVDIAGFRLADGRRITVAADWTGTRRKSAFLREVRDGACDLFATVLSPDYNAAHRDHLHLDQAERGALGWRACR